MHLDHLTVDDGSEAVLSALEEHGAVVVERLLSTEGRLELLGQVDPYLAATTEGNNTFAGRCTRRAGALIARCPASWPLALDPLVNDVAGRYLAPYSDGYQLHFTQAVSIGPGEQAQMLHRDRGVWGGKLTRAIETQLSTIWALSEFTEDNGATVVAPGSHRWDAGRQPTSDDLMPAVMPAGSVLIYNGSVLHGGGANRSEQTRTGALIHYTLNWLRQEENQYLSCPPEIAATLPPELRSLIGYRRGGLVLGFYSTPGKPGEGVELADPSHLFGGPVDSLTE